MVLEVGSAGLGIAPYLKRRVTGVDLEFKPPYHPLLEKVKGSATKLPFKNSSFDVVISLDMLEHLKKADRKKAIREMFRVAKRQILIGVPSGKTAAAEDLYLHNLYQLKFGKSYKFFQEQIKEKLPEKEDIIKILRDVADDLVKTIMVETAGNENITMHRFLMKGWMTKNFLVNIFFRKILLLFIGLLRLIDSPPYYRQLFFVQIKK